MGWWVQCIDPYCQCYGPRASNPEDAKDAFIDKMNKERVSVDKCPICGEDANLEVVWRWGRGKPHYRFTHKKANMSCAANRGKYFSSEKAVRDWVKNPV